MYVAAYQPDVGESLYAMHGAPTPDDVSGVVPVPDNPVNTFYNDVAPDVAAEAARRLGCRAGVIYYWIESGQLTARRGSGNRLHIPWNDQIQAECRSRIGQSGHLNPAARRTKPRRRR